MKHFLPFLLLSTTLSAQVYLKTADGPVTALPNNHPLVAEAYKNFFAKVEQQPIRVPDSVVLSIAVESNQFDVNVLTSGSARQNQTAKDALLPIHFEKPGLYTMAFVVPALDLNAIKAHEFDKFPMVGLCAEYTKTNRSFLQGCFVYEVSETNKMIFAPDFSSNPKLEGPVNMEFTVGTNGKIAQVTIKSTSYRPELNDHVLEQLRTITYPTGGIYKREQVAYIVQYNKDFYNFKKSTDYPKLLASDIAPEQKIFLYQKSLREKEQVKLDAALMTQVALAYLQTGDTATSNSAMSLTLDKEQRKSQYYYYVKGSNPPKWELLDKKAPASGIVDFAMVESRPIFPGCENEPNEDSLYNCFQINMMRHVARNFVYPKKAQKKKIGGRIYVNFVIEKDGAIGEIVIARGVHPALDAEAIRVVSELPKMTPAMQKGQPVRTSFTLPINAKVQ